MGISHLPFKITDWQLATSDRRSDNRLSICGVELEGRWPTLPDPSGSFPALNLTRVRRRDRALHMVK